MCINIASNITKKKKIIIKNNCYVLFKKIQLFLKHIVKHSQAPSISLCMQLHISVLSF